MKPLVKDQFWIALAAAVIYFTGLGATGLWDLDEPLYAACAREMADRGDWVVPVFNGQLFFDKPPLMFWLMISGMALFGQTEFAVRFWSPVIGIATALAVYHLGRLLFRREVGFWAGIVTASSVIFTVSARAATVDAALSLAVTLVVLAFVLANRPMFAADSGCEPAVDKLTPPALTTWLLYAFMWAMIGVTVLAKGPVGLLLSAATIGLFLMIRNTTAAAEPTGDDARSTARRWLINMARFFAPRVFFRALWQMRPLTGVLVVTAVAIPWYVLVGLRTDGLWLEQFFAKYNLGPFVQPFMGHRGPFYYHFVIILVGFFPWSLFLGPTLYHLGRRMREGGAWATGGTLLACWAGVWFGFWSVCSTKLPHYVLPAYPALALMTGCFFHEWLAEPARFRRAWSRNASATLVIVGVLLGIGAPIAAATFIPGEELIGLVGLPLIAGGIVCWHFHRRQQLDRMLPAFAVTGVAFLTALFAFAAERVDRHQHSPALAAEIAAAGGHDHLVGFRYLDASTVYYAGQNVPRVDDPAALRAIWDRDPRAMIITLAAHEPELRQTLGAELQVVGRRPRFLASGTVVVLERGERFTHANAPATMPIHR
jgi:4-amino-4-deoxy-L-arabinose transferase-like glycosyltransferase